MGALVLDLAQVAAKDRCRSWRRTIRDNYLDLEIRFKSPFDPGGKIVQAGKGAITFGAISSVAQVHERTQSTLDDDVDHLVAVMQFRGRMHLTQHSRDATLTPGQLLVLDGAHAYRAEFPDDGYQIFAVKMPRLYFDDALFARAGFVNVAVDERHGSMVIVDYFRRMARDFEGIALEQRARMSAHGVRMLVHTLTAAAN